MKLLKRASLLAFTLVVMCAGAVSAYAHDVPDTSRTGTISVDMTYDDVAVPGGTVTLYRVGDVVSDDGNYLFELGDDYQGSGVVLDDLQSPEAAEALAAWADDHGLRGTTVAIDDEGHAVFTDVELGLYLVAQHEPADGYMAIDPFLIGMPNTVDGAYVYDVDATPKLELVQAPEPPVTPEEDIPQTGDSMLPFVMVFAGGVLACGAGLALRARARRAS